MDEQEEKQGHRSSLVEPQKTRAKASAPRHSSAWLKANARTQILQLQKLYGAMHITHQ